MPAPAGAVAAPVDAGVATPGSASAAAADAVSLSSATDKIGVEPPNGGLFDASFELVSLVVLVVVLVAVVIWCGHVHQSKECCSALAATIVVAVGAAASSAASFACRICFPLAPSNVILALETNAAPHLSRRIPASNFDWFAAAAATAAAAIVPDGS